MMKELILCADDYSQNLAISEGILLLGEQKRINALSCLVTSPLWQEMHQELPRVASTAYIGLHCNLTHGKALSDLWQRRYGHYFSDLSTLVKRCYFGQLDRQVVAAEIDAQIDAFTYARGVYPDFIDGHQHIHQFPIIRDVLLTRHARHQANVFFRNTSNGWSDLMAVVGFPKRQLITLLGGMTFKKQLIERGIPTNSSFAGIYPFRNVRQYRNYFRQFLAKSKHNGLIMCHPGLVTKDETDPLNPSRWQELHYFMSDMFLSDLTEKSCQLSQKVS
jgi:predicted glycoside hydrolase/deacetylase ChbG (UPF0249 family)